MNIPEVSQFTFEKEMNKISVVIKEASKKSCIAAGRLERAEAIRVGRVNHKGIPMIAVRADGAWCTRSYKTNYNALSGMVISLFTIIVLCYVLKGYTRKTYP